MSRDTDTANMAANCKTIYRTCLDKAKGDREIAIQVFATLLRDHSGIDYDEGMKIAKATDTACRNSIPRRRIVA